jgi:hypothetical protein
MYTKLVYAPASQLFYLRTNTLSGSTYFMSSDGSKWTKSSLTPSYPVMAFSPSGKTGIVLNNDPGNNRRSFDGGQTWTIAGDPGIVEADDVCVFNDTVVVTVQFATKFLPNVDVAISFNAGFTFTKWSVPLSLFGTQTGMYAALRFFAQNYPYAAFAACACSLACTNSTILVLINTPSGVVYTFDVLSPTKTYPSGTRALTEGATVGAANRDLVITAGQGNTIGVSTDGLRSFTAIPAATADERAFAIDTNEVAWYVEQGDDGVLLMTGDMHQLANSGFSPVANLTAMFGWPVDTRHYTYYITITTAP